MTSIDSDISFENLRLITRRLSKYGTQGISISGGEPLSHPELIPILNYLADQKFTFLHILTNLYGPAVKINELIETVLARQIHLTTSFDGFGEVADKLRGGKRVSEKVMAAIEKLHSGNMASKRKIHTRATLVISQLNIRQVPEILEYFEKIQWEVVVDLYRFSSRNHYDNDSLKIKDLDELENVLNQCMLSPVVVTPHYILKGFIGYLSGDFTKKCPYLSSPVINSKYYIHPNGDVYVCIGDKVGNLIAQTPREILSSAAWKEKKAELSSCEGCWNTCYTTFGSHALMWEMARRLSKVTQHRTR